MAEESVLQCNVSGRYTALLRRYGHPRGRPGEAVCDVEKT